MQNGKNSDKRKIVVRYVALAVCLVVIAAVTIVCVFAANNWFKADLSASTPADDPVIDSDSENDKKDDDTPTVIDTSWLVPVSSAEIITPYDFTQDVTLNNCWHFHTGLDFAAEAGNAVVCCYDGTVESIVLDDKLDGNTITIKHENGLKTVYSFVEPDSALKAGDKVTRGQQIGTVSEATGAECMLKPHIHFEVIKDGASADPELYLNVSQK